MTHDVFPLPEITYPLVIDTIGKLLALGDGLSVHCRTYGCHNRRELNLYHLAQKLGRDYPASHHALKGHFRCNTCRAAGREGRDVGFIFLSGSWSRCDVGTRTVHVGTSAFP